MIEKKILPWRACKTFGININCSVIFISKNFFFFKFITHQSFRWSESWFAARERAHILARETCRSSPSKNLDWLRWSHSMSLNWKFLGESLDTLLTSWNVLDSLLSRLSSYCARPSHFSSRLRLPCCSSSWCMSSMCPTSNSFHSEMFIFYY